LEVFRQAVGNVKKTAANESDIWRLRWTIWQTLGDLFKQGPFTFTEPNSTDTILTGGTATLTFWKTGSLPWTMASSLIPLTKWHFDITNFGTDTLEPAQRAAAEKCKKEAGL
jgi:hypothetical protein